MEELSLLDESGEAREARDTPVGKTGQHEMAKTGQHRRIGDRLLGSRMTSRPASRFPNTTLSNKGSRRTVCKGKPTSWSLVT